MTDSVLDKNKIQECYVLTKVGGQNPHLTGQQNVQHYAHVKFEPYYKSFLLNENKEASSAGGFKN
jgi:hypothetical protein